MLPDSSQHPRGYIFARNEGSSETYYVNLTRGWAGPFESSEIAQRFSIYVSNNDTSDFFATDTFTQDDFSPLEGRPRNNEASLKNLYKRTPGYGTQSRRRRHFERMELKKKGNIKDESDFKI